MFIPTKIFGNAVNEKQIRRKKGPTTTIRRNKHPTNTPRRHRFTNLPDFNPIWVRGWDGGGFKHQPRFIFTTSLS